jgi:hypothetical protein
MVVYGDVFFDRKKKIMKPITKLELIMVAFALIMCGTTYGIWRFQTSEDNLIPSTSVQRVEKKQRPEKPAKKPAEIPNEKEEGFVGTGSVGINFNP